MHALLFILCIILVQPKIFLSFKAEDLFTPFFSKKNFLHAKLSDFVKKDILMKKSSILMTIP